jgi:hypothetical protein
MILWDACPDDEPLDPAELKQLRAEDENDFEEYVADYRDGAIYSDPGIPEPGR